MSDHVINPGAIKHQVASLEHSNKKRKKAIKQTRRKIGKLNVATRRGVGRKRMSVQIKKPYFNECHSQPSRWRLFLYVLGAVNVYLWTIRILEML
jgi:hypothetical protein